MGILVNRLLVMLNENESGTTFYYIALTLLEHIMELGNMNINEIAELCMLHFYENSLPFACKHVIVFMCCTFYTKNL